MTADFCIFVKVTKNKLVHVNCYILKQKMLWADQNKRKFSGLEILWKISGFIDSGFWWKSYMSTNQNSLSPKILIIAPPTWHDDFFSVTHRCNCDQRKRPRTASPWLSIFTSFYFQKITLDISQFWHFFSSNHLHSVRLH